MQQQPDPIPSPTLPDITDLVHADLNARRERGIITYGTTLQPFNGRSALHDAYEECLDLAQYLRQCLYEAEGV